MKDTNFDVIESRNRGVIVTAFFGFLKAKDFVDYDLTKCTYIITSGKEMYEKAEFNHSTLLGTIDTIDYCFKYCKDNRKDAYYCVWVMFPHKTREEDYILFRLDYLYGKYAYYYMSKEISISDAIKRYHMEKEEYKGECV